MTQSSIVPAAPKSWSQEFVSRARSALENAPPAGSLTKEAGSIAGAYVEASITGSLLGAAHAQIGLDSKYGPTDGWVAAAAAVAAIGLYAFGSPAAATHAKHIGTSAVSVLAFRRAYELVGHKPLPGGSAELASSGAVQRLPAAGPKDYAVDPIEAVARMLGK